MPTTIPDNPGSHPSGTPTSLPKVEHSNPFHQHRITRFKEPRPQYWKPLWSALERACSVLGPPISVTATPRNVGSADELGGKLYLTFFLYDSK